jgi:hypothetical protein
MGGSRDEEDDEGDNQNPTRSAHGLLLCYTGFSFFEMRRAVMRSARNIRFTVAARKAVAKLAHAVWRCKVFSDALAIGTRG